MDCTRYASEHANEWDDFVKHSAWNGTFLHTRRFLSYHGDRFLDASLILRNEDGRLVAIFPAAAHPSDDRAVVSHPGATFGGLVAGTGCQGEKCVAALSRVAQFYKAHGFDRLLYKALPHIYHQTLFQDDLYALFRLGARRTRCDLSAAIAASGRRGLTKGRKYEIGKAKKNGVEIIAGPSLLEDIFPLVVENLAREHEAKPVHGLEELRLLHSKFPEDIQFIAATFQGSVIAGLIMFNYGVVAHTQYIASNEAGRETGGVDCLVDYAINQAFARGYAYFDFGISNEKEGQVLNEGLYRYKRTFGAGGVAHEFYELDLGGY